MYIYIYMSQVHDGEGGKTKALLSVITWSQIHDGEGGSEPYEYNRTT